MNVLYFAILLSALTSWSYAVETQDVISRTTGNSFVVAFSRNGFALADLDINEDLNLSLFITTTESSPVSFSVTGNGFNFDGIVSSNVSTQVSIPRRFEVLFPNNTEHGLLVQAEGNNTINVLGISYHEVTADAYLALPGEVMPVDLYEYYAISYPVQVPQTVQPPSFILLVAAEDDTFVRTPSLNITLNRLETYQILSLNDLTGTRIISSKPISVLSGNDCAVVPVDNITETCNHLIEEIPPTVTWGTQFLVSSFLSRLSGDFIRVMSVRESVVNVTCVPSTPPISQFVLDGGGSFAEFEILPGSFCSFAASSPVLVTQYALHNSIDGVGDSSMMIIPSVEQYTNNFVFESFSNFSSNFINMYVTSEFYQPEQIFIDGSSVADWTQVACPNDNTVCGYISRMNVNAGTHSLYHQNSSARLGLSVYGFAHHNAYAYPGGMRLSPIQCDCEPGIFCLNNNRQFDCGCAEGFQGNGLNCTDVTPNISLLLDNVLSQHGVRELESGIYSVGYGHTFGVTCQTNNFARAEWRLRRDMSLVEEERTIETGNSSGLLYTYRESESRVVLRTAIFNTFTVSLNFGLQDPEIGAHHRYICVANNSGLTESRSVEIVPTVWSNSEPSYVRFTFDPSTTSVFLFAGIFSYKIVDVLVVNNSEYNETPTVQCQLLSAQLRREVDVTNGNKRWDCVVGLPASQSLDLSVIAPALLEFNIIAESSINISAVGFCDYELNADSAHGIYNWSETEVGDIVNLSCFYDNQDETTNSNTAGVSRLCLGHRNWSEIDIGECISFVVFGFQQVSIAASTVTEDNAGLIIPELARLTVAAVDTTDQSEGNLGVIATVFESTAELVEGGRGNFSLNENIITNITTIVSTISEWPSDRIRDESSGVVLSYDRLAESLVTQESFFNITIITPNVIFSGLQTLAVSLSQDGYNFNLYSILGEGDLFADNLTPQQAQQISVFLPGEVFSNFVFGTATGLAFTVYPNSALFPLDENLQNSSVVVGTPVLGVIVSGAAEVINLQEPVVITLPITVDSNETFTESNFPRCVFWNFTAGPLGNWSDSGCRLRSFDTPNQTVTCECDHLTNFAILLDIEARLSSPEFSLPLEVISYIGSVLSITGLLLTLLTLLGSVKLRSLDATKFQVQFCISLLCMLVVYLIGVTRNENEIVCTLMSALLQYFVLSSMLWMVAQGVLMFRKLVLVFGIISKKFLVIVSLLCWLLPLLCVGAALSTIATGTNTIIFRNENEDITICSISDLYVLLGTLLVPVILMLLINAFVFVAVLIVLIRKIITDKERNGANFKLVLGIFSISIVLGLAWIFSAFIINDAAVYFRYLFVICNTFQGFIFFIFIVIIGTEGRGFWTSLCRRNIKRVKNSFRTNSTSLESSLKMFSNQFQSEHKKSDLVNGVTTEEWSGAVASGNSRIMNVVPCGIENEGFEMKNEGT